VGIRVSPAGNSEAFFSASASDARSRGGLEDTFQLGNLQASGQLRAGATGLFSANLTAQWVRQSHGDGNTPENRRQLLGSLAYENYRVLGVPRLRFDASLNFTDAQLASRLEGDVDAPRQTVNRYFQQRVLYTIGRLELRVGMRIAKVEGRGETQWFLRVQRQFGDL